MLPDQNGFSVNDAVCFTQERLDVLTTQDRRRLAGRVGKVQGFYKGTRKPIVYFPATQSETDIRLFGVDPRQLELIAEVPDSLDENGSPGAVEEGSAATQSEADHLFD